MGSQYSAVTVQDNVAYFSASQSGNIYACKLHSNTWSKLTRYKYSCFGMAIVNDLLTAVGGTTDKQNISAATNAVQSLSEGFLLGLSWEKSFPAMPTKRMSPAVVATASHLVVAGGAQSLYKEALDTVEVMDINNPLWFTASKLPCGIRYPQMVASNQSLFISGNDHDMFLCSMKSLQHSCVVAPSLPSGGVWLQQAQIPVQHASLAMMKEQLLAVGGRDRSGNLHDEIYFFDSGANRWGVMGKMPAPRSDVLSVYVPMSKQMIIVGGLVLASSLQTSMNTDIMMLRTGIF